MPAKEPKTNPNSTSRPAKDYETLLRQVSDRVWELWREDLRRAQERNGRIGRHSK
ncbi:MAG: hypothetical protein IT321_01715 [Anaerolineae bacterium]|nr:hypothetical protein [Anaerolineae bacterium]